MKVIHFYLRYSSKFGQNLYVVGSIPELGNDDATRSFALQYLDNDFWYGSVQLKENTTRVEYCYMVKNEDGGIVQEGKSGRYIDFSQIATLQVQVVDTWNYAGEYENTFLTQPFSQIFFKKEATSSNNRKNTVSHIFRVKAPLLSSGKTVCIIGGCKALGNWQLQNALPMNKQEDWFTISLRLQNDFFPIQYKYGIWDQSTKQFEIFETGTNRLLQATGTYETVILHDGFVHLANNTFKGAGVAIPVFSLRSEESLGVGEFLDIKHLADWGKIVGFKIIQLLPINDTSATHTWTDSYPYAAISAFALHPMYLNIQRLAGAEHAEKIKTTLALRKKLNKLPQMDYEAVNTAKWNAVKLLFPLMKNDWENSDEYNAFYAQNEHWLLPYAAFCYFRDKFKTCDFKLWKTHQTYNKAEIEKMIGKNEKSHDSLAIHLFVQYHLHLQLKEAVAYTHNQGLALKGDIPIGIYRNSVDAWVEPALYNMNWQAGAPPDDFAIRGQNWGFPTYNWQKMQADGFGWWKKRFAQMSLYFDAFRIDHILGFFRIWSIPLHAIEGILGHFEPCLPVTKADFEQQGILFDKARYCKPYINEAVLQEIFGNDGLYVKTNFLDDDGRGNFEFKPAVGTQRKIEEWFLANQNENSVLKQKLFLLITNIILLQNDEENEDDDKFHFRINMEETISFKQLDWHTQDKLKALYTAYFFYRQNEFWKTEALQKLPALKDSTNMLVCGEDLGMVPDSVPGVMKDLGLLSLEVQRMPKSAEKTFAHPADAPYLSVVTPSTHDMSTIREWWEEDKSLTQLFYNQQLGEWGDAPYSCEPWLCQKIIVQHMYSTAMWSIFQLQDLMSIDSEIRHKDYNSERINIPANPKHYWRYRMHITIEQLKLANIFNTALKQLVLATGR